MKEDTILQPGEEIRPIRGYEGLYSITSFGRVWSHLRYKMGRNSSIKKCGSKFLKLGLNKEGYLYVSLCRDSKLKSFLTHRLEAIAFILNPDDLLEVNHKDGNKQNNYIGTAAKNYKDSNLEWCTHEENEYHAMKNGLIKKETSECYGVYFNKGKKYKSKPWIARTAFNKKQKYIGGYKTEKEAAQAYNDFVIKHNLNRPLNKI